MSVTCQSMVDRVRAILRDLKTRSDSSVITPFWSDAEIISEINAAVRGRVGVVTKRDKTFYISQKAYIGVTDATDAAFEYYNLPTSPSFRAILVIRRTDLAVKPALTKVEPEQQDPINALMTGMFDGLFATYPENLYPSTETFSIVSSLQIRIKPAPKSTSYTYNMWFERFPVDLTSHQTASVYDDALDAPEAMKELYCYDSAIALKSQQNSASAAAIIKMRDEKFADILEDDGGRESGPAVFRAARWQNTSWNR